MSKEDVSLLLVLAVGAVALVRVIVRVTRSRPSEAQQALPVAADAPAAEESAEPQCCIRGCTMPATRARPTVARWRPHRALLPRWDVDGQRGAEIDAALGGLCREHHDLWVDAIHAKLRELALAMDAFIAAQDREFISWSRAQLPKDQGAQPRAPAPRAPAPLPAPAAPSIDPTEP